MLSCFFPGRKYIFQLLSTAVRASLPSTLSRCHDWLLFLFFFSEEEKTCRGEWAYFSQVQNWSVVPGYGGHSQWSVLHCGNLKAISALTEYLWCLCSVLCTNSWNEIVAVVFMKNLPSRTVDVFCRVGNYSSQLVNFTQPQFRVQFSVKGDSFFYKIPARCFIVRMWYAWMKDKIVSHKL